MKTNQMFLIAALIATSSTAAQAQYEAEAEYIKTLRQSTEVFGRMVDDNNRVEAEEQAERRYRVNAQNRYEQNRIDTERRHQEMMWAIRNQN